MTASIPSPKYRDSVGIVLCNAEKLIWIGQRSDVRNDYWQMPQGGIDKGETPEQAMRRELCEETSIQNIHIKGQTKDWVHYDFPSHLRKQSPSSFYGQRQIWFLVDFLGNDKDIDVTNVAHQEFRQWQWATPQFILNNVIDFKKAVYEAVFHYFNLLE